MPTRQEMRAEETKKAILKAAEQLFASRGYDEVTMREIAKAAGCSHTTIYIYFKDKEMLLFQLSKEPLQTLKQTFENILSDEKTHPDIRLKAIFIEVIKFCLSNRNMYTTFFMAQATRVDEEDPALEINNLRNHLFSQLRAAIAACLNLKNTDEFALGCARIFFFTLQGILVTYLNPNEPLPELMERLTPTFDLAVDVMLIGFKHTVKKEDK
ncbi:TetR/AcrR family transcriptional regulator [Microbacteriaceae bacterium 4G12]